jgi:hypothetical protein
VKVDLRHVSAVVGEAVDAARGDETLDRADIVNAMVGRLGEEAEPDRPTVDPAVKKAAHDHLHAAATQLNDEGDVPGNALARAMVGVGLAILANGEDAETFYASFLAGGSHGA